MDYQEIKQKIKNCRDILVGIVPSPEAQVQQITIALMYKFMDDMDKEAQEKHNAPPMFFTGNFSKYSWTKLMSSRMGNQERMNLYAEAIKKMNENGGIPQLFRDIFKGAFLPYRSPESLGLFLKEINGFTYDNSENLGYAFEHLLSIMGSQGDAGMFRTPRHIIDFIVAAIDPQKNEQICDPSCGSAGFLISAYNHIIKANTKNKKGDLLSPEEKKKLIKNFVGYDISPDMVRLSKVNLYLHGFPNPTIFEYDTLSSEEKWDENFDVMLANPPFMSPKGGIRPHKRFSVQANRAEVLFVDYILEHLRPNGRAGIIVPEGIIFQSAKAYKALRKLLIEDGLLAVISLPPGVFNPYSGVKTSILLFDNGLAKKTKEILFLKISNDGFDLGAQRREIDKNDLPQALEIIKEYKTALKENKKFKLNEKQSKIAHLVAKEKIAESGDYNLSGDRYIETVNFANQKWPLVELGDILEYEQPTKYIVKSVDYNDNYKTPVLTAGKTFILGYTNENDGIFPAEKLPVIIFDDFTTAIKFVDFPFKVKSSAMKILHAKKDRADIKFLFHSMRRIKFNSSIHKRYWISQCSKIKIPLPPIEVQKEIVEQIEVKQKAIDAAKAVIESLERERRYFGQEIIRRCQAFGGQGKIKGIKWVELKEVADIGTGNSAPQDKELFKNGKYPFFRTSDVGKVHISDNLIDSRDKLNERGIKGLKLFSKNTILFPKSGASTFLNHRAMLGINGYVSSHLATITPNENKVFPKFLFSLLIMTDAKTLTNDQNYPSLKTSEIAKIKIPLPPIEIQKQLVEEMEEQEKIIEANKKLIGIMEQKIAKVISEI